MLKKIVLGVLATAVVVVAGALFWAKSVLTGETVRTALAEQVATAIGQPVSIGDIDAAITPRVTLTMRDVSIGSSKQLRVRQLRVATDVRALLSRRIEHASLYLEGAEIDLPLPVFRLGGPSAPAVDATPSNAPVSLVSIDDIVLRDVRIESGGRTMKGDIEIVPRGATALNIRRMVLSTDETTFAIAGEIADLIGPVGELTVTAGTLDLDQLLAFVNDFSAGAAAGAAVDAPSLAGAEARPARPEAADARASVHEPAEPADMSAPTGMRLALALEAERATVGGLALDELSGRATLTSDGLTLDPASFRVFGGEYRGSLSLTPNETLHFRGRSTVTNIDVAAAAAFAGGPPTLTGRLSGTLEFSGSGADAATAARTVRGKARVDIIDGVVRNLGLLNAVVTATSMRSGSIAQAAVAASSGSRDEPFTRLGATLDMANGRISTSDLALESKDLLLDAQGVVGLLAHTVDLRGRVQLSDELSQQAGRDLVAYTQDRGRVTLPATVAGSLDSPRVTIEVGDLAKRAVRNAVNEQTDRAKGKAKKAITNRVNRFFGR